MFDWRSMPPPLTAVHAVNSDTAQEPAELNSGSLDPSSELTILFDPNETPSQRFAVAPVVGPGVTKCASLSEAEYIVRRRRAV